jgi:ethanolamine transporter EutH
MIIVGAVSCFFGKRLFRLALALAGFAIGYYFVAELLQGQTEILMIAGSIVGGLIGAAIFYSLYKFN